MNYYLAALKKYAVFRGRASRIEYWMFVCFNVTFAIVGFILDSAFKTSSELQIDLANFLVPSPHHVTGFFVCLYFLAVFVPFLAVTVRRLHDTGESGWWCLLGLIPLVGTIWLIVLLATTGSREENTYGPAVVDMRAYRPLRYTVSD